MVFTFSVPAALSVSAGLFLLFMMPYVWRYRKENPSAGAYTALLGSVALWSLSYGVALTVFDPTLRRLLEIPVWTARILVIFFILVTGFKYSGHDRNLPRWVKLCIVAIFSAAWLLQVTNVLGLHTLMWDSFMIEPVMGAAGVRFEPTLVTYTLIAASYMAVAIAYLLAIEAVLSYGPLYRVHAVAIVIWSLPPLVANLVWLNNLGNLIGTELPLAGLDLTPPSLLITSMVLAYILFVREGELLEIVPANRRIAERVAEDDIDTGIVMVNRDGLVLGMNQPAAGIFGVDRDEVLTQSLEEVVGLSLSLPIEEPETVTFPDDPSRTYQISTSEIREGNDDEELGYTVSIQDITKQRRRQQRLEVLNRVLRHNLRNDMVVIKGNAEEITRLVEDSDGTVPDPLEEKLLDRTASILGKSQGLVSISEKARDISDALPEDTPDSRRIDLGALVESVADEARDDHPDAAITVSVPDELRVSTDEKLLTVVLENIIENSVVHNDSDEPTVTVSATLEDGDPENGRADSELRIEVSDNGPGIPDHEIEVIERGYEDPLEHGSGLGLWIVAWAVQDLGGTVDFEVDDGTTVTVTLSNLSPEEVE